MRDVYRFLPILSCCKSTCCDKRKAKPDSHLQITASSVGIVTTLREISDSSLFFASLVLWQDRFL